MLGSGRHIFGLFVGKGRMGKREENLRQILIAELVLELISFAEYWEW